MEKGSGPDPHEGNFCALWKFFGLNDTVVNCHGRITFGQNEGAVTGLGRG